MTRAQFFVAALLLCALMFSDFPLRGAPGQYVETFNTTTYKDASTTTANWDTGTGELKLPVFTPSLVGSDNTPGIAISVAVAGDLAFVADELGGLQVIDIEDPTNPSAVGAYGTPGAATDVAIAGDFAYVAAQAFGLQIISIEDPSSPGFVGSFDTPGAAFGVAVDGNLAYVADGLLGLHIIDVTNPAAPSLIKMYDTPGFAVRVAVAGNHVLVADDNAGVIILDVTDPAAPSLAGSYNSPGNATDIAVAGDLAYVADGSSGLLVLNIFNLASPSLAGSYDTPGFANDVAVNGDVAYVADDENGLLLVNILNPAAPTLILTLDTPERSIGVAVDGGHAFVADDVSGLQVAEVADPAFPRFVGWYNTPGIAYDMVVDGDLAFIADDVSGLQILNIANPASPTFVGAYNTPADAFGVAVAGNLAYVADYTTGLLVLNIANPASPTLVGMCNTPGSALDVVVDGNYAYVADGSFGLQVISIVNPASPTIVGNYDSPGSAGSVAVSGDLVLVTDALFNFGVRLVNVSNPASPTLITSYTPATGAPNGVVIAGNLAFVAYDVGMRIVDISNPAVPTLVGTYGPFVTHDVAVAGNVAFVNIQFNGVHLVDISNPATPTFLGGFDTVGDPQGVAVQGEACFIADALEGTFVVEAFNRQFHTRQNMAQSLTINSTTDNIVAARITGSETAHVAWQISADGGSNFEPIAADNTWLPITFEGNDLRWQTTHHAILPGVNPTVFDAQVQWLYEFASIDAVADVPADQGGWVRLNFTRSGRDLTIEPMPIAHYGVWRRVDDPALIATLATAPRDPGAVDAVIAQEFAGLPLFSHAGRTFMQSSTRQITGTMPPGTWEWIASIPALQQQSYLVPLATAADTPSQVVLVVTAHTTTPFIWYASAPDSGSSIDNIAPPIPTGFAVAYNTGDGNTLSWDPSPAFDFATFRIYRSNDPGFTPSGATLVHSTTSTDWSDPAYDGWLVYYKVTAVDDAGNESGPAAAATVTSIDEPRVPDSAALYQNHPNPFNPSTRIRYDVPRGGAQVDLAVYDVAGRRVRALLSQRQGAGEKTVEWNGRDDNGAALATGVYFLRATIGGFASTRKMIMLK